MSKIREEAIEILPEADKKLQLTFTKTCQLKSKWNRILINSCISEAQFQIDDAIAHLEHK